jgi:hypothetical protein
MRRFNVPFNTNFAPVGTDLRPVRVSGLGRIAVVFKSGLAIDIVVRELHNGFGIC